MFGTQKAKQRTFTTDIAAELPSLEGTHMILPTTESVAGVLRLRLGCQIPERGLWLAAVRIRWSGYFDTVEGVQRKDWSFQSGKKSLSAGCLLHTWLPKLAKLVRAPAVELDATSTAKAWENAWGSKQNATDASQPHRWQLPLGCEHALVISLTLLGA